MLICAFRYAPLDRTLLDVYAPSTQPADGRLLPVALFCHGGVWAHGKDTVIGVALACWFINGAIKVCSVGVLQAALSH